MVFHWKIDPRLDYKASLVQGYHWDETGLHFEFLDWNEVIRVRISFCNTVEYVEIKNIEMNLYCNDYVGELMLKGGIPAPINAFFYIPLSADEIADLGLYVDCAEKKMTKYIMKEIDLFVTIVSSVPPKIAITEV